MPADALVHLDPKMFLLAIPTGVNNKNILHVIQEHVPEVLVPRTARVGMEIDGIH
jgi:hypothetical protein